MQGKTVIPGAIICAEDANIGDILLLRGGVLRIERRKQGVAGLIFVSPVGMNASLMSPIGTHHPMGIDCVFHATAGVQRIGRLISRVNQGASATVGRAGKTARIRRLDARRRGLVDCLERSDPAILREVIVVHAVAGADDGALIGLAQAHKQFPNAARWPCGNRGGLPNAGTRAPAMPAA